MKCKRILSMLLTLCMVMSLFAGTTVTASAADGATTLYVNGVNMLSDSSTTPTGVSYDKSTNTLTLQNAALEQFHTDTANTDYDWKYAAVIYAVGGDLTIKLIGDNKITYNFTSEKIQCICGIYFNNVNLTITGTGTLAIQNTATESKANYYKDICGEENSSLTIDGTKVECVADSAENTLPAQVCGISLSKGALKVHNGQLTVRTRNTTSTAYGIELFGNEPHILNGNSQITAVEGNDGVQKSSGFCGICCFSTIQLGAGAKLYASGAEMAISENDSSITAADGAMLSVKGKQEYNASSGLTEILIHNNTIKANAVKNYKTIEVTASASTPAAPTFTDGFGNNIDNANTYVKDKTTNDKGYTFAGWFDEQGNELASAADAVAGKTYTAKWTKNGKTVRTTALDLLDASATEKWKVGCTQNGTLWTNAAEGWSWDTDTNTLSLNGVTIDIPETNKDAFTAVCLPKATNGATTVKSVAGTQNTICNRSGYEKGAVGLACMGSLTIDGSGELSITGKTYGIFFESVSIIKAPLTATAINETGTAVLSSSTIELDSSVSIEKPVGGKVCGGNGGVVFIGDSNEAKAKEVVIGAASPAPTSTFKDGFGNDVAQDALSAYIKNTYKNDKGYTFAGWFDGDGDELDSVDKAETGKTYTAKWTKNGKTVRTTALDLTKISQDNTFGAVLQGSVYTNSAEGWTWDSDKNILTLANVTMDITLSEGTTDTAAVRLPDGAILATAPGTDNNVTVNNNRACAIVGAGTLTIPAAETGKLTVVGGMSGICAKDIIINIPISVSAEGVAVYTEDKGTITIASGLEIKSPIGGKIVASEDASAIYEEDGTTPAKNVVIGIAKKYTVIYNTNGGSAVGSATVSEGHKLTAPNAPAKDGYTFHGWYKDAAFTNSWNFDTDTVTGNTTLYAKWAETAKIYGISGTVYESNGTTPASGVTVKLMKGDTLVASATSGADGAYSFTGIAPGVYNIVAEKDDTTQTTLVIVTNHNETGKNVTLPQSKVNSKLTVNGADTPDVVAGGLDEEAAAVKGANSSATSVKVEMTVESKRAAEVNSTDKTNIETSASGKTLEYLDIKVTKTVDGTNSAITKTENMMEIVIPYDMTGKSNITVYRNHGDSATAFTQLSTRPESGATDGTYYLDTVNHLIYVYTQKFSTYAIGYNTQSGGGSGSGGSSSGGSSSGGSSSSSGGSSSGNSSTISTPSAKNGTVSVSPKSASKGTTVTVTVTPDKGYELDQLSVKDKNGKEIAITAKGNGKYTFTMPAGKVTVEATFKSAEWNTAYIDCPKDNTCPIRPYTDAKATDWYHDGVHFCLENGLMMGYGDNIFQPNAPTTRSMLIVMLWRLNGSPVVNYALDFEDVKEGAWYTEAVRWAKSEGVAGGYGNGKFGPDDTLTREQMVAMLYRYAQYKGYDVSVGEDTNILSFGDATTVAEYAIPAMQWACGSGVVGGTAAADGSGLILDPKGSTTRVQMATMVMRFCAEIVK